MKLWHVALLSVFSIIFYRLFSPDIVYTIIITVAAIFGFFIFKEKRDIIIYILIFLVYQITSNMFIFNGKFNENLNYSVRGEMVNNIINVSYINGQGLFSKVVLKPENVIDFKGRGNFRIKVEKVNNLKGKIYLDGKIISVEKTIFDKIRDYLSFRIEKTCFNKITAGVMKALIIGDSSMLPKNVNDAFKRTGTSHVLVISGLHIAMMTLIILKLMEYINIGYTKRHISALIFLSFYSFTVGMTPSVARAYIMGATFLIAKIFWEESDLEKSFMLSTIIVALLDPASIFSISFLLSYGALAAIIYVYEMVRIEKESPFIDLLKLSFIIQLMLSPIFIYYFGKMPLLSFLANLIAVPVGNIAVETGFFIMAFIIILPFGSWIYGIILEYITRTLLFYIYILDKIPFMQIEVKSNYETIFILFYIVLVGTGVYFYRNRLEKKKSNII